MPGIKKNATIDDIVNSIARSYYESKKNSKNNNEIVSIIMDMIHDYIILQSENAQERELLILKKLLEDYKNLSFFIQVKLRLASTSSLVINSDLGKLIALIRNVEPYDSYTLDERARDMLVLIKANSSKADLNSTVITEDSSSTHSRDSRADSNATMFSDDDDDEVEVNLKEKFDFSNIESQEHKNRKLVGDLYKKSLDNLFDYCIFLQKTVQRLDIVEEPIIKDITHLYGEILKFKQNLLDPEHPMDIEEFLKCSTKAIEISYNIEKIVSIKIRNKQTITPEDLTAKLKSFSKENITLAERMVNSISKFINFLYALKDKINKYFKGKVTNKHDEKNLIMFHQITGLSKNDVRHLDELHYKVIKNAMVLKNKSSELK